MQLSAASISAKPVALRNLHTSSFKNITHREKTLRSFKLCLCLPYASLSLNIQVTLSFFRSSVFISHLEKKVKIPLKSIHKEQILERTKSLSKQAEPLILLLIPVINLNFMYWFPYAMLTEEHIGWDSFSLNPAPFSL